MKKHTEAPYYLTLKSNGCLILISALSPTHLLVASKHSLGTTTESAADEALVGGVSELGIVRKDKKGKQKEDSADDTESDAKVHAAVGRRWLKTTLERSGRTEGELAKRLWDDNLTAVLEVSIESNYILTSALRRRFRRACHRYPGSLDRSALARPQPQYPAFRHPPTKRRGSVRERVRLHTDEIRDTADTRRGQGVYG